MTTLTSQPDVTIVVVSWNTRELTLACLRTVAMEVERQAPACDVVLVDNNSSDGTVEAVASRFPSVKVLVTDANVGFARAANRGMAEAAGRYVLLVNSDAELPPWSIARLVGVLDDHSEAGAVGASLVGVDGERQFSCGRFLNPVNQFAESMGISRWLPFVGLRRGYRADELKDTVVVVDWCVGACLLLRRDALDEVGHFDERFFMYSEDEDLCFRLRKAGWAVLHAPAISVCHRGGGSAVPVLDRMRAEARDSQNAFMRKHFGSVHTWCFRVLMAIARWKPRRDEGRVGWGR